MAFIGYVEIKNEKRELLEIGWEYDDDPNDIKQRYAVMLFVPDLRRPDHWHIELTDEQAKELRDWLTQYLRHKKFSSKKRTTRRRSK